MAVFLPPVEERFAKALADGVFPVFVDVPCVVKGAPATIEFPAQAIVW